MSHHKTFNVSLTPEQAKKLTHAANILDHVRADGAHSGHVKHEEDGHKLFDYSYDPKAGHLIITPHVPHDSLYAAAEAKIREDIKHLVS